MSGPLWQLHGCLPDVALQRGPLLMEQEEAVLLRLLCCAAITSVGFQNICPQR